MIWLLCSLAQIADPKPLQPLLDATPAGGTLQLDAQTYLGPALITREIGVVGRGPGKTVISGQNQGPVLVIQAPGLSVGLAQLTLTEGRAGQEPIRVTGKSGEVGAAGLHVAAARQVTLEGLEITENQANGAVVYLGLADVKLASVEIHHNRRISKISPRYTTLKSQFSRQVILDQVHLHHNDGEFWAVAILFASDPTRIAGLRLFDSDYQIKGPQCGTGLVIVSEPSRPPPVYLEQLQIAPVRAAQPCKAIAITPQVKVKVIRTQWPDPIVPTNVTLGL